MECSHGILEMADKSREEKQISEKKKKREKEQETQKISQTKLV